MLREETDIRSYQSSALASTHYRLGLVACVNVAGILQFPATNMPRRVVIESSEGQLLTEEQTSIPLLCPTSLFVGHGMRI
jgi:hypothetical protein